MPKGGFAGAPLLAEPGGGTSGGGAELRRRLLLLPTQRVRTAAERPSTISDLADERQPIEYRMDCLSRPETP